MEPIILSGGHPAAPPLHLWDVLGGGVGGGGQAEEALCCPGPLAPHSGRGGRGFHPGGSRGRGGGHGLPRGHHRILWPIQWALGASPPCQRLQSGLVHGGAHPGLWGWVCHSVPELPREGQRRVEEEVGAALLL